MGNHSQAEHPSTAEPPPTHPAQAVVWGGGEWGCRAPQDPSDSPGGLNPTVHLGLGDPHMLPYLPFPPPPPPRPEAAPPQPQPRL